MPAVTFALAALMGIALGAAGVLIYVASRTGEEYTERDEIDPDADIQSLLFAMPQAHILVTRSGDVERASTAAYSLGLVRGMRITRSEIVATVRDMAEDGAVKDMEVSLRRSADGPGGVVLAVRVAPISRGRALVLFSDTTEAKRLEETRRDFVANISHELKTPIGAIGLLSETMRDVADEPENVVMFANQLHRESTRLASLVQDIIQLSRVQDGAALVDSELITMDEVVAEAIDRCAVEAESRGLTLVTASVPEARVYGDRALLTTAVRNLVDNAIRYSHPGRRVSVGMSLCDGDVRVAVVDEGVGIAPEQKERVFERFYRGDDARTRDEGGSGLGLSIVKHVAADHGGRVELWSEPGKGSTFTFIIPEAQVAPDSTEEVIR